MPKIDTSQIAGFETMTAEQQRDALLGIDIPEQVDLSKYVSKAQFDKTASELAASKKSLREKQTDDEKNAADLAEREAANQAEKAALLERAEKAERMLAIASYKTSYLSLGYDEKLAQETAEALARGDTAKVFENQGKHKEALEKKIKEQMMMGDPRPGNGGGANGEKDSAIEYAKKLAKSQTDSNQAAKDALKYYA